MKIKATALLVIGALVALALVLASCTSSKNTRWQDLPGDYQLTERAVFKIKNAFDVSDDRGNDYGKVSEDLISWTRTFTWYDGVGEKAASASVALVSWGTRIDVLGGDGKKVGTIKEEVLSSMFKTWTTYKILDDAGNEIATSQKVEWLGTSITLTGNDGKTIAVVHRPAINLVSDTWKISVKETNRVDSRVLVMIAAFKTAVDNDREAADKKKKDTGKK